MNQVAQEALPQQQQVGIGAALRAAEATGAWPATLLSNVRQQFALYTKQREWCHQALELQHRWGFGGNVARDAPSSSSSGLAGEHALEPVLALRSVEHLACYPRPRTLENGHDALQGPFRAC